jgi:hypothetical protein
MQQNDPQDRGKDDGDDEAEHPDGEEGANDID